MIITRTILSRLPLLRSPPLKIYQFCNVKIEDDDDTFRSNLSTCRSFYQKSIRRVNVKEKTGRGKFSEHTLSRMMKLAQPEDLELLFEAFYNYMGHFTVYSNKVVDSFVHKALHLAKLDPSLNETAATKVLELFKHHDYLGYFPSYKATINVAKIAVETGKFKQFLNILNEKLLIKIDRERFEEMMGLVNEWAEFSKLAKIGANRINWEIIQGMDKHQLLKIITQKADTFDSFQALQKSNPFIKFLESFDETEKSGSLALGWLIVEGGIDSSIEILKSLPKEDPLLQTYVNTARKLDQDSEEDIVDKIQKQLENTHHSSLFQSE